MNLPLLRQMPLSIKNWDQIKRCATILKCFLHIAHSFLLSYNRPILLDNFTFGLSWTLICLSKVTKVSLGYDARIIFIVIYKFDLCTELFTGRSLLTFRTNMRYYIIYGEDSGFLLVNNAMSRHTFIMEMVRLEERCALHFSQTLMSIKPHM